MSRKHAWYKEYNIEQERMMPAFLECISSIGSQLEKIFTHIGNLEMNGGIFVVKRLGQSTGI